MRFKSKRILRDIITKFWSLMTQKKIIPKFIFTYDSKKKIILKFIISKFSCRVRFLDLYILLLEYTIKILHRDCKTPYKYKKYFSFKYLNCFYFTWNKCQLWIMNVNCIHQERSEKSGYACNNLSHKKIQSND